LHAWDAGSGAVSAWRNGWENKQEKQFVHGYLAHKTPP
jgi:hypothetical protein